MSATPQNYRDMTVDEFFAAFDALLAIAKGADEFDTRAELREKINALDAAYPDWRTWTA